MKCIGVGRDRGEERVGEADAERQPGGRRCASGPAARRPGRAHGGPGGIPAPAVPAAGPVPVQHRARDVPGHPAPSPGAFGVSLGGGGGCSGSPRRWQPRAAQAARCLGAFVTGVPEVSPHRQLPGGLGCISLLDDLQERREKGRRRGNLRGWLLPRRVWGIVPPG